MTKISFIFEMKKARFLAWALERLVWKGEEQAWRIGLGEGIQEYEFKNYKFNKTLCEKLDDEKHKEFRRAVHIANAFGNLACGAKAAQLAFQKKADRIRGWCAIPKQYDE